MPEVPATEHWPRRWRTFVVPVPDRGEPGASSFGVHGRESPAGRSFLVGDGQRCPVRISICHCLACQRRTGSVFGEQARFPRVNVSISGASTEFERVGDEGSRAKFHFCPRCGSTVYYEPEGLPEFVAIPVGALCRFSIFAADGFCLRISNAPVGRSTTGRRAHSLSATPERQWLELLSFRA